jgi:hypothetical protein
MVALAVLRTLRMLAVADQFSDVLGLTTVLATVLSVAAIGRDRAFAWRMSAFLCSGHHFLLLSIGIVQERVQDE